MVASEFNPSENLKYTRLPAQVEQKKANRESKYAPYFWNTTQLESEADFVEVEEVMANEFDRWENVKYTLSPTQMELLEALLEPDDAPYPWNTTQLESEACFVEAEQEFEVEDCLEQEIAARAQTFFNQLDQLWEAITPAADVEIRSSGGGASLTGVQESRGQGDKGSRGRRGGGEGDKGRGGECLPISPCPSLPLSSAPLPPSAPPALS